mgnify:CR=1 FL=1
MAARLAAGATGPSSVLEGRRGIYSALTNRPTNFVALTGGAGHGGKPPESVRSRTELPAHARLARRSGESARRQCGGGDVSDSLSRDILPKLRAWIRQTRQPIRLASGNVQRCDYSLLRVHSIGGWT